jgi:hypothetical protein
VGVKVMGEKQTRIQVPTEGRLFAPPRAGRALRVIEQAKIISPPRYMPSFIPDDVQAWEHWDTRTSPGSPEPDTYPSAKAIDELDTKIIDVLSDNAGIRAEAELRQRELFFAGGQLAVAASEAS